MFGFGKKNDSFLGIDIGTSAIKALEIKLKDNKPVLSNYAWMQMGKTESEVSAAISNNNLPQYLKRLVKDAGFESKSAFVSLPSFGGLITLINFPEMEEKDVEQAIKFEAHKYVPAALDDVVLSWDIVGRKNGEMEILLVAAPKNKVERCESVIREAGLDVKSIEIESFSLVRSLVGNDKGKFAIVDIGSRICNIILVEEGMIKVNMNIDAGGRDITRVIAKALGIDDARAEKMKISGKNFFNGDSGMVFPVLDMIVNEVRRVLYSYYKNEVDPKIAKIDGLILSGGAAKLCGIGDYFSKALGVKVIIGDPLGRIGYDKKIAPKMDEIRGRFSVCAGLAMKGAEEYLKKK